MTPTNKGQAKVSLPSDNEILITREFNAPRRLVFKVMHTPEYIRQWFGCGMMEVTVCEVDFRVGGTWRYVLRNPSGDEHGFSGDYREINAPEKVVSTERYEPIEGSEHVCHVTLLELPNNRTSFQNHIVYPNRWARDGHLQSGMEEGMNAALTRLDEISVELAAEERQGASAGSMAASA